MKKLTNKKMKLFGKEVSVFLVAMVAMIGLGSAALVPYLSDTVTGTVDVDHPFMANISEGHVTEDQVTATSVDLGSIVGGETVPATIRFQYLGTQPSVEIKEIFMINNTNVSCNDFESIEFDSGNGWNPMPNNWCTEGVDSLVISDPGFNDYTSGEINLVKVKLNFKLNAYGDYDLSAQIIPKP